LCTSLVNIPEKGTSFFLRICKRLGSHIITCSQLGILVRVPSAIIKIMASQVVLSSLVGDLEVVEIHAYIRGYMDSWRPNFAVKARANKHQGQ
jgi:hypothetical protein